MPKPNYFEIQADEPERAMKFYEQAFGWTFNKSSLGGRGMELTQRRKDSMLDSGFRRNDILSLRAFVVQWNSK